VAEGKPLTLDDIIRIEPRIGEVLHGIQDPLHSLKRFVAYSNAKLQLSLLVGWCAENHRLCSSWAYDVVMDAALLRLNLK